MARITCSECGYRYSSRAKKCPKCRALRPGAYRKHVLVASGVIALLVLAVVGLYLNGNFDHAGQLDIATLQKQEAEDAVEHYAFDKKYGSNADRCRQAGLAAAAFRELKDGAAYRKWKDIQTADCGETGKAAESNDTKAAY